MSKFNILNRSFSSREAGEAIGIEVKHITNWATRGFIVGQSEGGKGKRRLYSFNNLLEITLALELMAVEGLGPESAFRAARRPAFFGGAFKARFAGDVAVPTDERMPGLPFHHSLGDTVLVVGKNNNRVILTDDGRIPFESDGPVIVVSVSKVFQHLCGRLGLDPESILDFIYKVDAGEGEILVGEGAK